MPEMSVLPVLVRPGRHLGILSHEDSVDLAALRHLVVVFVVTAGEETLMSLSRMARRISLPALFGGRSGRRPARDRAWPRHPGRTWPAPRRQVAGTPAKPVIVLVHGAWADASNWSSVIRRAAAPQLHRVRAAQPAARPAAGLGLSAPVPDPERGTPQGRPWSWSGTPTAGPSSPTPRPVPSGVRALVYVDAFIPDEGDTIGGLASAEPGSCLGNPAEGLQPRALPRRTVG